jgi:hypothetical protein
MKNLFKRLFYKDKHILIGYTSSKTKNCKDNWGVYKIVDFDGNTKRIYVNSVDSYYGDTSKIYCCVQAYERDGILIKE